MLHNKPQESVAVTVVTAFLPGRQTQNGDSCQDSALVQAGLCRPTAPQTKGAHCPEAALLHVTPTSSKNLLQHVKLPSSRIANLKTAIGCLDSLLWYW